MLSKQDNDINLFKSNIIRHLITIIKWHVYEFVLDFYNMFYNYNKVN